MYLPRPLGNGETFLLIDDPFFSLVRGERALNSISHRRIECFVNASILGDVISSEVLRISYPTPLLAPRPHICRLGRRI